MILARGTRAPPRPLSQELRGEAGGPLGCDSRRCSALRSELKPSASGESSSTLEPSYWPKNRGRRVFQSEISLQWGWTRWGHAEWVRGTATERGHTGQGEAGSAVGGGLPPAGLPLCSVAPSLDSLPHRIILPKFGHHPIRDLAFPQGLVSESWGCFE